jgi:phosphoesterase RecJ-like protein
MQAVVFFKQTQGNHYRVSLRSKGDVDVGAIAKEFNGGGHKNAAGCSVDGPIDELRNIFVDKVSRAIDGRSDRH